LLNIVKCQLSEFTFGSKHPSSCKSTADRIPNFVFIQHFEIMYTFLNFKQGVSNTYKIICDYIIFSSSITNPVSVLSMNTSEKALHA